MLGGYILGYMTGNHSATVAANNFLRNGNVGFRGFVVDSAIFKGHNSPLLKMKVVLTEARSFGLFALLPSLE
jgi:hypothetical protein